MLFRFVASLSLLSGVAHAALPPASPLVFSDPSVAGQLFLRSMDGDLLWYRHDSPTGDATWTAGSGKRVGVAWRRATTITASGDGHLYSVSPQGNLYWSRLHGVAEGTGNWEGATERPIGSGWQIFRLVFASSHGVIYGIDGEGNLKWYKDLALNGTSRWHPNSGVNKVGTGWQTVTHACSPGNGVIYAIDNQGQLRWYRATSDSGEWGWAPGSANVIGTGWGVVSHLTCSRNGVLYAVNRETGNLHWYRDLAQNGSVLWANGTGNAVGSGWINFRYTPPLANFGYGTPPLPELGPITGTRPLVAFVVTYSDANGVFPPRSYYEQLLFGRSVLPPFTAANPASLDEFFRENSNGKFGFSRAGAGIVYVTMGTLNPDPGPEERLRRIFFSASQSGFDFSRFDSNGDGTITNNELMVLTFENVNTLAPANRPNNPITVNGKRLTLKVALNGNNTSFDSVAHELSHSIGTADLYNNGCMAQNLTLMSCTDFNSFLQNPRHLDAWHKMRLGWVRPKIRRLDTAETVFVDLQRSGRDDAPVLLWDGIHSGQYFLVERRRAVAQGGDPKYDGGVGADGFALWSVGALVSTLGPPSLSFGSSTMWGVGMQTPTLRFQDGTNTGTSIGFTWDGAQRTWALVLR